MSSSISTSKVASAVAALALTALASCKRDVPTPAPVPVAAGPVDLHEEAVRIPNPESGAGTTLEGTFFRPSGAGPFPLVMMNHGAIGKRDPAPRWRPLAHAEWFVARGYAVLVPMRRGNAQSDGAWAEGYGPCETADYTDANRESARDLKAALAYAATRPEVDARHVVLHGMSAGGFAVLTLASSAPAGVVGVLDFAGGRGSLSFDDGATRHNCNPHALVSAVTELGTTTKVPTLWLYAQNDHFFPPPLAREMFEAFRVGDADSTFVALPPYGKEGHAIGWEAGAIPNWSSQVDTFLARIGLPHH